MINDTELTGPDLKELVARYKEVYRSRGKVFPEDPREQLRSSIHAVFDSWRSERADVYRSVNQIVGLKVGWVGGAGAAGLTPGGAHSLGCWRAASMQSWECAGCRACGEADRNPSRSMEALLTLGTPGGRRATSKSGMDKQREVWGPASCETWHGITAPGSWIQSTSPSQTVSWATVLA